MRGTGYDRRSVDTLKRWTSTADEIGRKGENRPLEWLIMSEVSSNSKQLVLRALRGEAIPRAATGPLAVHYCAHSAGVSLADYTQDPHVLADCVLRYYEQFRPDAVWVSADTWVTAQAMGKPVAFPAPINRWPAHPSGSFVRVPTSTGFRHPIRSVRAAGCSCWKPSAAWSKPWAMKSSWWPASISIRFPWPAL